MIVGGAPIGGIGRCGMTITTGAGAGGGGGGGGRRFASALLLAITANAAAKTIVPA